MPTNEIKIVYRNIDELIPYANNPRDNAKAIDAVAKSLRRFGARSPAIVDKDGVIIAGHTRLLAARKIGLKEFPVVVADDLTPAQAAQYRLMDNRAQEESQWDSDFLSQELKELKVSGFDLSDTGFTPFEIDSLTFDFAAAEAAYQRNNYTPETGAATTIPHDDSQAGEYGSMHPVSEYEPDDDELPYSTYNGASEAPARPYPSQEGTNTGTAAPAPSEPKFDTFACIICCASMEEQDWLRDLLREEKELQPRYAMREILWRLS